MKMLLIVKIPNEVFNEAIRNGSVSAKIGNILEELKPSSVIFTELDGYRTCLMTVEMNDSSEIPKYSEPWFLMFDAEVHIHPYMAPEDLVKSGLDELGKKWI